MMKRSPGGGSLPIFSTGPNIVRFDDSDDDEDDVLLLFAATALPCLRIDIIDLMTGVITLVWAVMNNSLDDTEGQQGNSLIH
jgi:hypothetical protein